MLKISSFSINYYRLIFLSAIFGLFIVSANAQVNPTCVSATASIPGFATDFDTLAITGTGSTVAPGTGFAEALANANSTYTAGTGSGTGGDTYSFGSTGSTERAFGGLQSGTLNPTIGACIQNNTGGTLSSIVIRYDGEQWRLGTVGRVDRLDFQYSTDASSLTTGTWTDFDALDFTAPTTTGGTGALDGNAAANRTAAITSTITALSIANGATFYVRFNDLNATGADDGLAIDNFSIVGFPNLAAPANVGGRVVDSNGNGLSRVQVKISGGELSQPIFAVTNPFGYFNFEVPAGQTYAVTVSSKSHNFSNPTQIISVNDNVTDITFTSDEIQE